MQKVSKSCWENGTDSHVLPKVATEVQFVLKKKGIPVGGNKIIKPGMPLNTTLGFLYNRLKYQRTLRSKHHLGLACLTKPGSAPSPDGSAWSPRGPGLDPAFPHCHSGTRPSPSQHPGPLPLPIHP